MDVRTSRYAIDPKKAPGKSEIEFDVCEVLRRFNEDVQFQV